MGRGLRRCQDDRRTPRPSDPPLPHLGDRERQLPLQGKFSDGSENEGGEKSSVDPNRKPNLKAGHFC